MRAPDSGLESRRLGAPSPKEAITVNDEARDDGEEKIEDLEAPAAVQQDVTGGLIDCIDPTCGNNSKTRAWCQDNTCNATKWVCNNATGYVVIYDQ